MCSGGGRVNKRVELHSIESVSQILARPQVLTWRHRVGSSQTNKAAASSGIVWQQPKHHFRTANELERGRLKNDQTSDFILKTFQNAFFFLDAKSESSGNSDAKY